MARRDKTFKPDKDLKIIRHQELCYFCQKAAKASYSKESLNKSYTTFTKIRSKVSCYSKHASGTQNVKI